MTAGRPAVIYQARPQALPGDRTAGAHHRVRTNRVDSGEKLTLRDGMRER